MNASRRWAMALVAVFLARTAYAGLVHGPLLLTPLVYVRFPTAMNPALNLPALLAVEALITILQVGAYAVYFRNGRASVRSAVTFSVAFGIGVYLPQNLLNLILLSPVHELLVAAWVGAGVGGAVVSTLALRAVCPSSGSGSSDYAARSPGC